MKTLIVGIGMVVALGLATAAEAFDRPCLASAAAPVWKEGDSVPCSTDLAGSQRSVGGGGGGGGDASAANQVTGNNSLATIVTATTLSGSSFFSVLRTNITTASVNLAFGFTSRKVLIRADSVNTDDICLDWLGGTAVCPAANTAGNARIVPGQAVLLDDFAVASVSVIAASGTQRFYITAWR